MTFLLIWAVIFGCSCDSVWMKPENVFKLDIVHYNDFHARFEETSLANSICRTNDELCLGGFPRLYHLIKQILREKPDSILLNAGDNFQGTYWYTALKGSLTDKFLNMLPHDAHGIGNHEFDGGPQALAQFLSHLKAPVLAANLDTTQEPALQGLYRPSIVVERKGRKIGIIGLITEDISVFLDLGKVKITDPSDATRREAIALKEKGVDVIIVLSHCGLEVDKRLAQEHGYYIDVIVGGHTHSLLWNGVAPSGEKVAGPYPVVIETNGKHKVLIVQTSSFTKYIGNLTVYFDSLGNYIKHEGDAIFLDRSIPEDLEVKRLLQPYADQVHKAESEIVGDNLQSLNYEDCVKGECALGNLLTDSIIEYAKTHLDPKRDYVAFYLGANIRSNIQKGKITKGVIFELLPYYDHIQLFELKGKLIKEALEKSVSDVTSLKPFSGRWMLQVSGLRVTYDLTKPEGQRVMSVFVGDKESNIFLKDDQTYHCLGPRFWLGYPMFINKVNPVNIGRDSDILEAYIKGHSPLNIHSEGRILIKNKL